MIKARCARTWSCSWMAMPCAIARGCLTLSARTRRFLSCRHFQEVDHMNTKLYLGTRKGLIEAERTAAGWKLGRVSFLGVQVPMLLPDARDGTLYAAVDHGHFGTKFHASCDGGATWEERTCP